VSAAIASPSASSSSSSSSYQRDRVISTPPSHHHARTSTLGDGHNAEDVRLVSRLNRNNDDQPFFSSPFASTPTLSSSVSSPSIGVATFSQQHQQQQQQQQHPRTTFPAITSPPNPSSSQQTRSRHGSPERSSNSLHPPIDINPYTSIGGAPSPDPCAVSSARGTRSPADQAPAYTMASPFVMRFSAGSVFEKSALNHRHQRVYLAGHYAKHHVRRDTAVPARISKSQLVVLGDFKAKDIDLSRGEEGIMGPERRHEPHEGWKKHGGTGTATHLADDSSPNRPHDAEHGGGRKRGSMAKSHSLPSLDLRRSSTTSPSRRQTLLADSDLGINTVRNITDVYPDWS